MRNLIIRTALFAGAAFAIAGCNRQPTVNNISTTNDLRANMSSTAPANDASAMESMTNTARPAAPSNSMGNSSSTGNGMSGGPGSGHSTNNVESNTVGM